MNIDNYILYVGNNCSSCNKIENFITEHNIPIKVVNIDEEEVSLPFSLMIVPALVKDDKLIGYGPDILKRLEKFKSAS